MDRDMYKMLFETYWDYFKMQSAQRMKMVEFYITIMIVLVGGFITLISMEERILWALYADASSLTIISLVFGFLDYRTHFFIHEAEAAIVRIEAVLLDQNEERVETLSDAIRAAEELGKGGLKYEWCFYTLFTIIGIAGIVLIGLLSCGCI